MIDIKLLRENPGALQLAAANKGVNVDTQHIFELDKKVRELTTEVQKLQEERNAFTKEIKGKPDESQITKGKALRESMDAKETELSVLREELNKLLLTIPNPSKSDVKVGGSDKENDVIKKYKEPTVFSSKGGSASGGNFTPKDHLELGTALGIIDMEAAAKVSGARFVYLKGDGALLEFALLQFAMEILTKEGFIPVIPPVLIKRETMQGLGYMENGGEEDMFQVEKDNLFLVGTAEQSLVPQHMDDVLQKADLPRRYVGFSPSFRREAGAYGKDTRGILRLHQFNKVEMVSFVPEGEDDKEHEYLLSLEEKLFQLLDIPYQVIKMCTGDLGFPAARKYDIEAWMPGQGKYREVTSVSTVTDFQSRRLNMRYQDGTERKYLNVLNGTAFAMSRTPIAILENYQQEDGSVVVPEVLRKYMGKDILTRKI